MGKLAILLILCVSVLMAQYIPPGGGGGALPVGASNCVVASPANGSSGTVACRAAVSADLPSSISIPGSVTSGSAGGTTGAVDLSGLTSGKVTLSVLDTAGTWTMKLPNTAGTNSYVLTTDGSGNTSWAAQTGSGGTSIGAAVGSGTSGSALYVDVSGNLAQSNANLKFDATNKNLHVGATGDGATIGNILGQTGFGGLWVGGAVGTPSDTNYAVLDATGGGTVNAFNAASVVRLSVANVAQVNVTPGFVLEVLGVYTGCTHGSNGTCGMSTLSSGTVTVSTTKACTLAAAGAGGCAVKLTLQTCSSCGTLSVGTVTNGTSFVINSTNGSDASLVYWHIEQI